MTTVLASMSDLNEQAFDALFRGLGPSRAIRFLRQYRTEPGVYEALKEEMFKGMNVGDIVREMDKLKSQPCTGDVRS